MLLVLIMFAGVFLWGFVYGRQTAVVQCKKYLIRNGIMREEDFPCEKDWLKN